MELPLRQIKKKQKLIYRHYLNWTPHELRVVCKENWGGIILIKCKVLSKDWYDEVYLTQEDFSMQVGSRFKRVEFLT